MLGAQKKRVCLSTDPSGQRPGSQLQADPSWLRPSEAVSSPPLQGHTWLKDDEATHCKQCEKEFSIARRKVRGGRVTRSPARPLGLSPSLNWQTSWRRAYSVYSGHLRILSANSDQVRQRPSVGQQVIRRSLVPWAAPSSACLQAPGNRRSRAHPVFQAARPTAHSPPC